MENQEKIDRIERHLNHELSPSEEAAFVAALKQDKDLSDEFERRRMAHKALDFMISENLRDQLKKFEDQDDSGKMVPLRKRRRYILAIAASLLVLIGAFFIIDPFGTGSSSQQILAYYEAPDFSLRSGQTDALPSDFLEAIQAMEASSYDLAIQGLRTIIPDHEHYVYAQYLLGHAHYQNQNYNEARQSFDRVAEGNDLRYIEDAQWFGLLSCLMEGSSCLDKWEPITRNQEHSYYQQAMALSKKLR